MFPSLFQFPFIVNTPSILYSQSNYSGAYGGGKAFGDGLAKMMTGDFFNGLLGFGTGLTNIGLSVYPLIWQNNNIDTITAQNKLLQSQSFFFPQQWPTGIPV